jgi:hypothetical protein
MRKTWSRAVKVKSMIITLTYSLLAGGSAYAQGLTQPWDETSPMTPEDLAIIRNIEQQKIHEQPADTVATWTNPASGHSGTITLLGKSVRQGMPCERIEYQIMEPGGRQQHGRYVFTSCKIPDGTWKIAD